MTFTRRAASELTSRVKLICGETLGEKAGVLTDALAWAGTFHGIGARLLRENAEVVGLDPDFTIHDREDSADLMNLVRHDAGLSSTDKRFPAKGTCLAIYSRAVNSGATLDEVLGKNFSWCIGWSEELRKLFAAYVEAKQAHTRSITTICCSIGRKWSRNPIWPGGWPSVSITSLLTSTRTPTGFRLPS